MSTLSFAELIGDVDRARTGTHYALIADTSGDPNSWVSLGRPVRLPAGALECSFNAFIKVNYAGTTLAVINVEAIGTADWTYEALRTYSLTDLGYYSSYRYFTSSNWTPGTRDITIRIVAVGQYGVLELHADDVSVRCKVA